MSTAASLRARVFSCLAAVCMLATASQAQEMRVPRTEKLVDKKGNPLDMKYYEGNVGWLPLLEKGEIKQHDIRTGAKFDENAPSFVFKNESKRTAQAGRTRDGGYTIPDLPNCMSSGTYRKEIGYFSDYSDLIDLVYFRGGDKYQQSRAEKWKGNTVPYYPGTFGPKTVINEFTKLVSAFGIRCLPARVNFVGIDGKRHMQVREGEDAWIVDPPIQKKAK
jgi:hypothetical protein